MFKSLIFALAITVLAVALPRVKRAAYELPDGAELIVGSIKTSFSCNGLGYGYYADVDNNCQIFHVCNPIEHPDGTQEVEQYSFFCGNQTVFNQGSLTCADPDFAVPCNQAQSFFDLNNRIGDPKAYFLEDSDVQRINQAIESQRGRR
ncbi:uncharacterized protein LOC111632107 [Centruroides sculpturatus]|uniref:uncharacterized protein LOC111632107 n=1 Tax=Centruroides sculpturatus TaxID=218467 RepID=UPI000C6D3924|nr:uncharacterized protein LOC111632107 [Centruroides sculpturatus]